MLKSTHSVMGALVFALLAAASTESVADFKVYAASECERWNENVDPATYLNWSRRFNPSTARRLRLDCPAVKDRLNSNILWSWIRVIDRSSTDQVCARIVAFRHFGNSLIARNGAAQCTGIAFNSPNAVQLNTGGLGAILNDMHYYFSVFRIPARTASGDSGVVTYFVNEANGID